MYTYCFWVKIVPLAFGPKMVIFDGWGRATWPSRWVRPHLPSPGEVRCASLHHGIISFFVVVFVFSFDLVQNYWKWSNHWVALCRTFAMRSPEGLFGLEKATGLSSTGGLESF